ncbi:MAG: hypothetical protein JM58_04715 [Peptococcaceae bacterium BICA1-8]|nr:MAG: hypothetical protein JM58_04715 [Peptococcaceae bacterium BICA1-8]
MKKLTSTSTLALILITLTLITTACGTIEVKQEDIQSVTLTVGGPEQEEHTVVEFQDTENFKHFLAIEKQLDKYKPKDHMISTWKLDVKFEYHLTNGEIVAREYKGIRPVDEFLKDLYNSQEYKEQTIPLFKLDKGEVKKVKFDSYLNQYEFTADDSVLINSAYENLLQYYQEHDYFGGENDYLIASVELFGATGEKLAEGPILRGDKNWAPLFNSHYKFRKLKYWAKDIAEVQLKQGDQLIKVTEPQFVQEILDTYKDGSTGKSVVSVEIIPQDSSARHLFGSYEKDSLPESINNLVR